MMLSSVFRKFGYGAGLAALAAALTGCGMKAAATADVALSDDNPSRDFVPVGPLAQRLQRRPKRRVAVCLPHVSH